MILFSLVTAGNLLVNGWLSYMILAPIYSYDSALSGGLGALGSALGGLADLAGTSGLGASIPSFTTGGFSFLANSDF